jgi:Zn finger protein HypA/HybF involved in hydrogenase expression
MNVAPLYRTLDQELVALARGASLECLCCGEFVMHASGGDVFCPECGSQFVDAGAVSGLATAHTG